MTTFKVGRIGQTPYGEPVIDTGIMAGTGPENILYEASSALCSNFKEITGAMRDRLCLYDPSALGGQVGGYTQNIGKLYLLPLDKTLLAEDDVIETTDAGEAMILARVLIITHAMTNPAHIWNTYYNVQKPQYYVPLDSPMNDIGYLLAKISGGEGLFMECICSPLYDDIKLDLIDKDGKFVAKLIKGSEMATYKLPWWNADNTRPKIYRSPDWNKTFRENGLTKDEVIFCQLYKPGNALTAYGGAGKPDYTALGVDVVLDIIFSFLGRK
jgi:hypothetical protein